MALPQTSENSCDSAVLSVYLAFICTSVAELFGKRLHPRTPRVATKRSAYTKLFADNHLPKDFATHCSSWGGRGYKYLQLIEEGLRGFVPSLGAL